MWLPKFLRSAEFLPGKRWARQKSARGGTVSAPANEIRSAARQKWAGLFGQGVAGDTEMLQIHATNL
jgi:hypothetical protein